MNSDDIITFDVKKNFKYVKPLGDGGTGETYLFKDETTDMLFAIKKYITKDSRFIDEYYKRFVDEIKILFNISHPNIVRVYNYYLYPVSKTGMTYFAKLLQHLNTWSKTTFCIEILGHQTS